MQETKDPSFFNTLYLPLNMRQGSSSIEKVHVWFTCRTKKELPTERMLQEPVILLIYKI